MGSCRANFQPVVEGRTWLSGGGFAHAGRVEIGKTCHPDRGRPTAEWRDPLKQETGEIAGNLLLEGIPPLASLGRDDSAARIHGSTGAT